ncbi:MAG TPA: hypothetical protein VL284_12030 [Thermoanaerobaculia bacterium]|nr:hypothetical protein [Thermoanaerobaculia bacterium]
MLPILVPLFALALGPEIPLGSTRITSAPYNQTLSSVASNGRDFLALWSDQRNTLDPNQPPRFPALTTAASMLPDNRSIRPVTSSSTPLSAR